MTSNLSGPTNDYLHANPQLYGKIFDAEAGAICLGLYDEFHGGAPATAIDIGCGMGREVAFFAQSGIDAMGVDFVPNMISHARQAYPAQEFRLGDLRNIRVGRTFDLVTCLGSCLNYMLTNEELSQAIESLKAHCHPGSLIVIEPLNASSFVGSSTPPSNFSIPGTNSIARAEYRWNQLTQVLHRDRYWKVDDSSDLIHDTYVVRLLFSQELKFMLECHGLTVLGFRERRRSSVYSEALFIVARFN